jgi:hypothetical protein
MLYLLITLQALDVVSTYLCIKSGKGREANRWLSMLMDKLGVIPALVLTKGTLIVLLVMYGSLIQNEVLIGLNVLYAIVVANNFKILKS